MVNNINSKISVLKVTANSGKAEGTRLIIINNGVLEIVLDESHGLDILSLRHKGTLVSLLTANGLNNHGHSFVDSFPGGMLYTCGPDTIGAKDGYYQHGQYHLNPAEIITLEHDEDKMFIKAKIEVTALFGVNFSIFRELSSTYNSESILIKDTLVNNLDKPQQYALLYHFNLGYPFLQNGTKIYTGAKKVEPKTEFANKYLNEYGVITDDVRDDEEVFYHYDTSKTLSITSPIKKKWTLTYDKKVFPYVIEWKSLVDHNFALALEPATSLLDEKLKYQILPPNGKLIYEFNLKVEDIK